MICTYQWHFKELSPVQGSTDGCFSLYFFFFFEVKSLNSCKNSNPKCVTSTKCHTLLSILHIVLRMLRCSPLLKVSVFRVLSEPQHYKLINLCKFKVVIRYRSNMKGILLKFCAASLCALSFSEQQPLQSCPLPSLEVLPKARFIIFWASFGL